VEGAAEQIIFNKNLYGALSDLKRGYEEAYSIVSVYGMNEKIGNVSFLRLKLMDTKWPRLTLRPLLKLIDVFLRKVRKLIASPYERTIALLTSKKGELRFWQRNFGKKEIHFQAELGKPLLVSRPFEKETTYQAFTNKKESAPPGSGHRQKLGHSGDYKVKIWSSGWNQRFSRKVKPTSNISNKSLEHFEAFLFFVTCLLSFHIERQSSWTFP